MLIQADFFQIKLLLNILYIITDVIFHILVFYFLTVHLSLMVKLSSTFTFRALYKISVSWVFLHTCVFLFKSQRVLTETLWPVGADSTAHFTGTQWRFEFLLISGVAARPSLNEPCWWLSACSSESAVRHRRILTLALPLLWCSVNYLDFFFFLQPLSNPRWSCDTSRNSYKA